MGTKNKLLSSSLTSLSSDDESTMIDNSGGEICLGNILKNLDLVDTEVSEKRREKCTCKVPWECLRCIQEDVLDVDLLKALLRSRKVGEQFICVECEELFLEFESLTEHMKSGCKLASIPSDSSEDRSSPKSEQSDICIKSARRSGEPFSCPVCDKEFTTQPGLSYHLKTHTGEKPHGCSHCGKKFLKKSSLTVHVRLHTGEKPHACSRCDMKFICSWKLTRHLRLKHSVGKPYACPHCDDSFSVKAAYTKHVRTHTGGKPHACSYCEKKFAQKSTLTRHVRMHTGERPFACPHCDEKFKTKWTMTNHIRRHTGEKPFSCPHCDGTFTRKSSLNDHLVLHTGTNSLSES